MTDIFSEWEQEIEIENQDPTAIFVNWDQEFDTAFPSRPDPGRPAPQPAATKPETPVSGFAVSKGREKAGPTQKQGLSSRETGLTGYFGEEVDGSGVDFFQGGLALGRGILDAARDQFPEDVARVSQGKDVSLAGDTWQDKTIAEQQADARSREYAKGYAEDPGLNAMYQGPKSVLSSIATGVGGGLLGRAVGTAAGAAVPVPGAAAAGGFIGQTLGAGLSSGAAFYNLAANQFLTEIRDRAKKANPDMTEEDWAGIKAEMDDAATRVGLWEAGPEALSQAFTMGLFGPTGSRVLKGLLPRKVVKQVADSSIASVMGLKGAASMAKLGAGTAGEELTEGVTYYGQEGERKKAGLRTTDPSLSEFIHEQAGAVAVGSLLQAGVHRGAGKAWDAVAGTKEGAPADNKDLPLPEPVDNAPLEPTPSPEQDAALSAARGEMVNLLQATKQAAEQPQQEPVRPELQGLRTQMEQSALVGAGLPSAWGNIGPAQELLENGRAERAGFRTRDTRAAGQDIGTLEQLEAEFQAEQTEPRDLTADEVTARLEAASQPVPPLNLNTGLQATTAAQDWLTQQQTSPERNGFSVNDRRSDKGITLADIEQREVERQDNKQALQNAAPLGIAVNPVTMEQVPLGVSPALDAHRSHQIKLDLMNKSNQGGAPAVFSQVEQLVNTGQLSLEEGMSLLDQYEELDNFEAEQEASQPSPEEQAYRDELGKGAQEEADRRHGEVLGRIKQSGGLKPSWFNRFDGGTSVVADLINRHGQIFNEGQGANPDEIAAELGFVAPSGNGGMIGDGQALVEYLKTARTKKQNKEEFQGDSSPFVEPQENQAPSEPSPGLQARHDQARSEMESVAKTITVAPQIAPQPHHIMMQVRSMSDESGQGIQVAAPYDGTKEDALRVARGLRLYAAENHDASMRQSETFGTDEQGKPVYAFTQGKGETVMHGAEPEAPTHPIIGKHIRSGSTTGKVLSVQGDGKYVLDSGTIVTPEATPNRAVQDEPFTAKTETPKQDAEPDEVAEIVQEDAETPQSGEPVILSPQEATAEDMLAEWDRQEAAENLSAPVQDRPITQESVEPDQGAAQTVYTSSMTEDELVDYWAKDIGEGADPEADPEAVWNSGLTEDEKALVAGQDQAASKKESARGHVKAAADLMGQVSDILAGSVGLSIKIVKEGDNVDQGVYSQIKPLLQQAFDHLVAAGKDMAEYVSMAREMLNGPNGRAYFRKFVTEDLVRANDTPGSMYEEWAPRVRAKVRSIADPATRDAYERKIEAAFNPAVKTDAKTRERLEQWIDDIVQEQAAPETAPSLAAHFEGRLKDGAAYTSIVQARKEASAYLGRPIRAGSQDVKLVDEAVEAGVVRAARAIILEGRKTGEKSEVIYDRLVDLYGRQPVLGSRTSTSVAMQAYSTPVPIAFLASELAGIDSTTTVYEPTAGNGALVIGADPSRVIVNEMDSGRKAALESQGFSQVHGSDAVSLSLGQKVDVVIGNPPFGRVKKDNGEAQMFSAPGMSTPELDQAVMLKALESMDDNGSAVFIIGGKEGNDAKRRQKYGTANQRRFWNTLLTTYNVTDLFSVSGDLYSRQGAGYPLDVIVIHGRNTTGQRSNRFPAAKLPRMYESFESLQEMMDEKPSVPQRDQGVGSELGTTPEVQPDRPATEKQSDDSRPGDVHGTAGPQGAVSSEPGSRPQSSPAGSAATTGPDSKPARPGKTPEESEAGRGDDRPGSVPDASVGDPRGELPGEKPSSAGKPGPAEPDAERGGSERVGGGDGTGRQSEVTRLASETGRQVNYTPASKGNSFQVLVPVNIEQPVRRALKDLESRRGPVDAFVARELGYAEKDLNRYFAAEQVDAIAMAVDNIKNGAGFILGDQTGVGKGRVNAAMIRYAQRQGIVPVFVTYKKDLYAAMVEDLSDIGMPLFSPLVTNSGLRGKDAIPLKDGRTLTTQDAARHTKNLDRVISDGMSDEFGAVFTTYSQLQSRGEGMTPRQQFLLDVAPNSLIILDESHNAGGQANARPKPGTEPVARLVRQALDVSPYGAFYSSATYAKRPDVMSLYFKTDMAFAVGDISKLAEAISAGGVPMQQAVAATLTESGQYIRRERTYDGVEFQSKVLEVDTAPADQAAGIMQAVRAFDDHKQEVVEELRQEMAEAGQALGADNATGKAGMDSTRFTSIMHNLIDQFLLALKADAAVSEAVEAVQRGEKPLITVASTMGAAIEQYTQAEGVVGGDSMDMTFADLFQRYLDRSREVRVKDPEGRVTVRVLSDTELGPGGRLLFKEAQGLIDRSRFAGIPVSPIDHIRNELEKQGVRTEEITGRTATVDYSDPANPVFRVRKKPNTNTVMDGFNSGKIDVLVLNQSGSTGISLHASEKFEDQSTRYMIVAQAEKDINQFMQMLGRIFRTGQVVPPRYALLSSSIPAEKRMAAILSKKMASLNATTTASRSSDMSDQGAAVDFMNKYGDEVSAQLLRDNRPLAEKLGLEVPGESKDVDGLINKLTGRIPLLPVQEQAAVYDLLETEYTELLDSLEKMGMAVLEAKSLALDAKTLKTTELAERTGPRPFQAAAVLEEVDVRKIGKPYTSNQVTNALTTLMECSEEKLKEVGAARMEMAAESLSVDFEKYLQEKSKKLKPESFERFAGRARQNMQVTLQKLSSLVEGYPVQVTTSERSVMGVVLEVKNKKKTEDPAAGSNWKVKIALADASREMNLSFSRINLAGGSSGTAFGVVPLSIHGLDSVMQEFDNGQSEVREKRLIVTGNVLAGFSKVNNKGQIVSFTRENGENAQGILLPKEATKAKIEEDADVSLDTPAQVLDYLQRTQGQGMVKSADKLLRVGLSGDLKIVVPAAKSRGGKYFLNQGLLDAMGRQFVKSGSNMQAHVPDTRLNAIVEALHKMGVGLVADTHKADARRAAAENKTEEVKYLHASSLPGSGISLQEAQGVIDSISDLLSDDVPVKVLQSNDELPAAIQDDMKAKDSEGSPGMFWNGTVYVVTDNVESMEDLVKNVLGHELTHAGLAKMRARFRGMTGKAKKAATDIDRILRQVWMAKTREIRELAKEGGQYHGMFDLRTDKGRLGLTEEWLANHAKGTRWYDKFVAAVRRFLRAVGDAAGFKVAFSEAEVRDLLDQVGQAVMRTGAMEGQGAYSRKNLKSWPTGFPNSVSNTTISHMEKHPDYEAAKAGDVDAAVRLIRDRMKKEKIQEMFRQFPDAVVLAPHAEEFAGRNAIPRTMTAAMRVVGFEENDSVVQANRPTRTGKESVLRLVLRPKFDGDIERGRDYILVDDAAGQGGTFSELREFVESGGGRVVHSMVLAHGYASTVLPVQPKTIEKLIARFGRNETEQFLRDANTSGRLEALTEKEGRFIGQQPSLDALRNRIVKEARKEGVDLGLWGVEGGLLKKWNMAIGKGEAFAPADDRISYSRRSKNPKPAVIEKAFGSTDGHPIQSALERFQDWQKNWRTRAFDRYRPILEQLDVPLDANKNESAYVLHRMAGNSEAVLSAFLAHGKLQWDGKALTVAGKKEGFLPWLQKLGPDGEKLLYWIAMKRAEVLESEGREKWLTPDVRQEILDWIGDSRDWETLAQEFRAFNDNILDMAEEAGLIDPEGRDMWTQDYYLPFYRLMEDPQQKDELLNAPKKSRKNISAQIKKLTGKEAKLGDPLENILRNWAHLIDESQRNVARAQAYEYGQMMGIIEERQSKDLMKILGVKKERKWAVRRPEGKRAIKLYDTQDEAEAAAAELTRKKKIRYVAREQITEKIKFGNQRDLKVLSFQDQGKPVYFEVLDAGLFNALAEADTTNLNGTLMGLFGGAKRLLVSGATFGPSFRIANALRDTLHTSITSRSFMPFVDTARGIVKVWREDGDFRALMASGGGFGKGYVTGGDPKATARLIQKIVHTEGKGARNRIIDTPAKLLNLWQRIGEASEMAARVQYYKNLKDAGVEHVEAAYEAKDLLDFSLSGDAGSIKILTTMMPFLNARMQGLYKLGRAAKERPKAFLVKGALFSMAALALWYSNKDRPEYKELEDWDRWNYFHFWIGDKHFRIPKPFEIGMFFATMPEVTAEVWSGNEEGRHVLDFLNSAVRSTLSLDIPQLVKPAIEVGFNKSTFTGRPIEGMADQGLPAGLRSGPWTSKSLAALGEQLGVSPKKAQALLKGYLATYADILLWGADWTYSQFADLPPAPGKKWHEQVPALNSFMRERSPARRVKQENRAYDLIDELDKLYAEARHYKDLAEISTPDKKAEYMAKVDAIKAKNPNLQGYRKYAHKLRSILSQYRKRTRAVMQTDKLDSEEKRRRLDQFAEEKNRLVKHAYEQMKKRPGRQ